MSFYLQHLSNSTDWTEFAMLLGNAIIIIGNNNFKNALTFTVQKELQQLSATLI